MPETIGEAFVAIRPATAGFGPELQSNLGGTLKSFAETLGAVFVASKVTSFFKDSISAGYETIKVGKQTEAVLKSTGDAANVSAGHVNDLADSLSKMSGVDDEAIQSAENLILTFRDIRNEAGKGNDVFDQTTKVVLDMSKALGEDLKSASIQVGKALEDPTTGLTALRRVGVSFTAQQKEQIAAMQQSGNLLGAQKIILKELATEFGGSAAAQATSAEKAKVAIDNLRESIGIALIPVEEQAAKAIGGLANAFNSLPAGTREAIVDIGTLALTVGGLALAFNKVKPLLQPVASGIGTLASKALPSIFGEAATSAGGFGAALTGLGLPIAATITAGVALGFAVKALIHDTDQYDIKLNDLATVTIPKLAKRILEFQGGSTNTWGGFWNDSQVKIDATKATLDQFNRVLDKTPQFAQKFIDAAQRVGVNTADMRAELAKHVDQTLKAQRAQEAYQAQLDRANFVQVAGQLREYVKEVFTGTSATDAFKNITEDAQKALQGLSDTLTAQTDAQFAYDKSVNDVAKDQDALNQAIKDNGPFSKEASDAAQQLKDDQLRLAEAAITLDQKTGALNDSIGGSADAATAEILRLQDLQQRYPAAAGAIQPLIDRLVFLRGTIQSIPDVKNVNVALDVQGWEQAEALANFLNSLPQNQGIVFDPLAAFAGVIPGRAGGGPVGPGAYIVGEHGPELLTLGANGKGFVTDAATTATTLGAQRGGDTIVVNNYGAKPTEPEQAAQIVAKLRARDFLRV